jgi:hypothetical protein
VCLEGRLDLLMNKSELYRATLERAWACTGIFEKAGLTR